jgi:hypothetical protein
MSDTTVRCYHARIEVEVAAEDEADAVSVIQDALAGVDLWWSLSEISSTDGEKT